MKARGKVFALQLVAVPAYLLSAALPIALFIGASWVWDSVTYLPRYGTFDAVTWTSGSDFDRALMLDDLDRRVLTYRAMNQAEVVELLGKPDSHEDDVMRWDTYALFGDIPFGIEVTFHPDDDWEYSGESEINDSTVTPVPLDDPFL